MQKLRQERINKIKVYNKEDISVCIMNLQHGIINIISISNFISDLY